MVAVYGQAYAEPIKDVLSGVVKVRSVYSLNETVSRLKANVVQKKIMFFLSVDQAKLAADARIALRPSTLLIFGNPPLGSQLISSNPAAGLDWPVRLLVIEDEKKSGVGYLHRLRLDCPATPGH